MTMSRAQKRKRTIYAAQSHSIFLQKIALATIPNIMRQLTERVIHEWVDGIAKSWPEVWRHLDHGFYDGDTVTRDGTDIHIVMNMSADRLFADFKCIKSPDTAWCQVDDIEHNLCRRYEKVDAEKLGVTPELQP